MSYSGHVVCKARSQYPNQSVSLVRSCDTSHLHLPDIFLPTVLDKILIFTVLVSILPNSRPLHTLYLVLADIDECGRIHNVRLEVVYHFCGTGDVW